MCDHIRYVHLNPVTICPSKMLEEYVFVSSPRTLVAFAVYDIHDALISVYQHGTVQI